MTFGSRADQADLARALTEVPGLLPCMARSRHGHTAAKSVFRVLDGIHREDACAQIYAEEPILRQSRYGQLVLSSLKLDNQKRAGTSRLHNATLAAIGGA